MKLLNYIKGEWVEGQGQGAELCNPVTGEALAYAGSEGLDLSSALNFSRVVGNPALQTLSYAQRASLLNEIAKVLTKNRDKYIETAQINSGNTIVDAMIDVDGGIGTLQYFASLGKRLGSASYIAEPGLDRLSREKKFQAVHILTPLKGVAIHINAFNFPSWGLWEKAAVSLLAGVPVFAKPATATSFLSYQMMKDVVDANISPKGSLSFLCGGGHDLMGFVQTGDAVVFTGSAETATKLRTHSQVVKSGVRINIEADSINMTMLSEDVVKGSPLFDAFIKEVIKEMTTKAGQKCTAIRRIMVPISKIDEVSDALINSLSRIIVGDPKKEGVRMGPLINKAQQLASLNGISKLKQDAHVIFGDAVDFSPLTADVEIASFVQPTLLRCDKPLDSECIHETEVFGPVAVLMPYTSVGESWELAIRGGGSLICSVFTGDEGFALNAVRHLSNYHGRVLIVNEAVLGGYTGHGIVMPQCVHGGPGRAGGGEELGGMRGVKFYHQRTAIQGDINLLSKIQDEAVELP